jgi:hypothetical protein
MNGILPAFANLKIVTRDTASGSASATAALARSGGSRIPPSPPVLLSVVLLRSINRHHDQFWFLVLDQILC